MKVNFIKNAGSSYHMSVNGKLVIQHCDVTIEENFHELEDVKLENCVLMFADETVYTDHAGRIYKREPKNKIDLFKEEGIAIYVKGKLVYGIHPDNVENNIEALDNGSMKFDWKQLLKNAEGGK
jgi:hypothetical protein